MKKVICFSLLFLQLIVMGYSQSTCSTATSFPSNNYTFWAYTQSTTSTWFSFTSDSTHASVSLFKTGGSSTITGINVYSGNCSGLILQDSTTILSDSIMSIIMNGLTINQQYYIEIQKSGKSNVTYNLSLMNYLPTLIPYCSFTCGQQISNGDFELNTVTSATAIDPFSPTPASHVNCWGPTHGTPQIASGAYSGSFCATMWTAYAGVSGHTGEGIYTRVNVLSGHKYVLTYAYKKAPASCGTVDNLYIDLSQSSAPGFVPAIPLSAHPPSPTVSQTIAHETSISSTTWLKKTICFTANNNYDVLYLYPDATSLIGCNEYIDVDHVQLTELTVNAGPDITLNCSSLDTIGSYPCTPIEGVSYSWSPVDSILASIDSLVTSDSSSTVIYTHGAPGSAPDTVVYVLTATVGASCSAVDTVHVIVAPSPLISAGPDDTICSGSSTILNATGAISYHWYPSSGLSSDTVYNPAASPLVTTTYLLVGNNGYCISYDTITIYVKPLPTFSGSSSFSFCNGDTTSFIPVSATPSGTSVSWTNSNTSTGIPTNGFDSIPSFVATNSGTTPIQSIITITGTFDGCSAAAYDTITVNPTPNVVVPANFSICRGLATPVSNFTSSSPGTTYSWTNSNTAIGLSASGTGNVPSFIAIATGTATITVTPSIGGCPGSPLSYTITVLPSPTVSITPSSASISPGGSVALSVTPSSAPSYSWSPGLGLSSTTIYNPVATPPATTTYSVTVTNILGCSGTNSVTITVNHTECGITTIDIPDGSHTSTFFSGSSIYGNNYSILGNLIVDNNFQFVGCNLIMKNSTSKITVQSGAFLLLTQKTHLYSCVNMWDGIYVLAGGKIGTNTDVVIEDAMNAVNIAQGVSSLSFLDQTLFNKNVVGINYAANTSTVNPITVTRCYFTSRDIPFAAVAASNLLTLQYWNTILAGAYPSSQMRPPNSVSKGVYGIKATDVNTLLVGSTLTGYGNGFENIKCGIKLISTSSSLPTNTTVYNNTFKNLLDPTYTSCVPGPCFNEYGYGIFGSGTSDGLGSNTLIVGGAGTNEPNIFADAYRGMEINYFKNVDVIGNTFSTTATASVGVGFGNTGVLIKPAQNNTLNILNNAITNCKNGIWVNRIGNGRNSTSIIVDGNTISANSSGFCNYGVNCSDGVAGGTTPVDKYKIQYNTITQAFNCIAATNVSNCLAIRSNAQLEVRNDGVTAGSGVNIVSCQGVKVHDNQNINLSPVTSPVTATNVMYKGVQVYASPSSQITCNKIFNMGESMTFVGSCVSSTLRNNQMTGGNRGFVLRTNGEVGSQGSFLQPCGLWWDPNFTAQTYTDGTTNANTNSRLSVNNSGAPSWHTGVPMLNGFGPGGIAYSFGSGGLNNSIGSPMSCSSIVIEGLAGGGGESMSSSQLLSLATDSTQYPVYSAETQYLNQKLAYDQLDLISESSAIADPQLDLFYQNNQNSAIGQLKTTDKAIAAQDISTADVINNNVIPVNVIDENQKTFNSLFIAGLNDPGYQYAPAELAQLSAIAEQCPSEGGPAVWQSRVLLSTIADDWLSFTDPCVQSERIFQPLSQQANNSGLSNVFSLYPNPGNGDITLRYSVNPGEKAVLCIYEMSGKNVGTYNLNSAEKSMQLHLANLQSGVYYYSISINSKIIQTDKLVIIR